LDLAARILIRRSTRRVRRKLRGFTARLSELGRPLSGAMLADMIFDVESKWRCSKWGVGK
jgi:hypothetical protein